MHTMMKTGAVAATLLAAVAMTATPSRADDWGAAAAGFVAGAAVGSIAANSYNNGYYYGPRYGYGYAPRYSYYAGPRYHRRGYGAYAYAPAYGYGGYGYSGPADLSKETIKSR